MHRGDSDAGGAADLQTDIMRFMAILALCLVAIFALVQSIPLTPEAPAESTATAAPLPQPEPVEEIVKATSPEPAAKPEPETNVVLTRPKWKSRQSALPAPVASTPIRQPERTPSSAAPSPSTTPPLPPKPTSKGFSLRFESDLALTRLVAAGKVGLYAIGGGRAQRMTVSESRISFWDASTPNAFHEMEVSTVPAPVIDALTRTGTETRGVDWGVTLPGKLSGQLNRLMREHEGGTLVIGMDGELRLEAT
jgi:hypothetical protein